MARPSLQPAEVERFRQRLCEVALQRFAEDGFAGVTLRALARDLGCSYATPYRYFRDKEHIFAAVRSLAYERFGAALESAAVGESDPERRLRLMLKSFVRFGRATSWRSASSTMPRVPPVTRTVAPVKSKRAAPLLACMSHVPLLRAVRGT